MALIEWPADLHPSRVIFYLRPHVGGSVSPMTRTRKVYGLSAPMWVARLTFNAAWAGGEGPAARGARIDALIADMEGGLNRAMLWDFRRPYPAGLRGYYSQFAGATYPFGGGETFRLGERFFIPAEAEPLNETARAGSFVMSWSGFKPHEKVFNAGDYFGGDGRPHMFMHDGVADADGRVTMRFRPALATDILAGQSITMRPPGKFQLMNEDAGASEALGRQPKSTYTLEFEEDLA